MMLFKHLECVEARKWLMENPSMKGWNHRWFVSDVLYLCEKALGNKDIGPWVLCLGNGWFDELRKKYTRDGKEFEMTLSQRLCEIEDLIGIVVSPKLETYAVVLCNPVMVGV